MNQLNTRPRARIGTSKRGSALIISIISAAIITIGLASLLPTMLTDWKMTARTSAQEAAFSLAESGVDEAIWAVLEFGDTDKDWEDAKWTEDPTDQKYWYKEWDLAEVSKDISKKFTLNGNRQGVYRVIVEKPGASTINIISQGIVRGGSNVNDDFEVSRFIETQFSNGGIGLDGLIARNQLAFSGQPKFNSFNSDEIIAALGDFLFNTGYATENVTVGSASGIVNNLSLSKAWVYGNVISGAVDDGITDPSSSLKYLGGEMVWEMTMEFPDVTKPAGYTSWNSL